MQFVHRFKPYVCVSLSTSCVICWFWACMSIWQFCHMFTRQPPVTLETLSSQLLLLSVFPRISSLFPFDRASVTCTQWKALSLVCVCTAIQTICCLFRYLIVSVSVVCTCGLQAFGRYNLIWQDGFVMHKSMHLYIFFFFISAILPTHRIPMERKGVGFYRPPDGKLILIIESIAKWFEDSCWLRWLKQEATRDRFIAQIK